MKFLSKLKYYYQNEKILKDTKIYSLLILGGIYFLGFFKALMSGGFENFSLYNFAWVSLVIIPTGILISFWYAIHEHNQKSD
ncbi:hypothetical protein AAY72_12230 [Alishewanella sp. WH16-1]|uniref:hypothetical protein n=1 Tax=Alishewanella sp. WH16-1 TaxID=1651088 RepID=UPI00070CC7AD|nr:hypothetical protein [Alishewanella sp. WH16-1]KRS20749.1 hypothetical protein AAY72_12230 [Alishewanella sp. WH16-1]